MGKLLSGGSAQPQNLATGTPSSCLADILWPAPLALNPEEGRSWLERAAGQGVADAEAELSSLTGNAVTEALH